VYELIEKTDAIGVWRSGQFRFQRYETSDLRIRVYGNASVVTGIVERTGDSNGRHREDKWRFTKMYIRRGGKWLVVAFHASTTDGRQAAEKKTSPQRHKDTRIRKKARIGLFLISISSCLCDFVVGCWVFQQPARRVDSSASEDEMSEYDRLITARLMLRRIREADLEDLVRMHADDTVMTTLGGLKSAAETRAFLDSEAAHWDRNGFGLWVAREPGTDRFVGRGGLRRTTVEGVDEVEVAYALMAEDWGKGLATELARASLGVGLGDLGLSEIVSFTLPTNAGSRRVMEKIGMRYEREIAHKGHTHVLYRINCKSWRHGEH
jgi:RimJ/RimL family protein N-acetyltransferase